jgi:hypothetical protein
MSDSESTSKKGKKDKKDKTGHTSEDFTNASKKLYFLVSMELLSAVVLALIIYFGLI